MKPSYLHRAVFLKTRHRFAQNVGIFSFLYDKIEIGKTGRGMTMDWIGGLQAAIDYMEENITEELDYDEIAKRAFSSKYHFGRIFGILSGMTLGEYIRNRRLSLAGAELRGEHAKVIDVALKYGYESPDSFTKAFVKFHGITPSEARAEGAVLRSFSRLSIKISLEGGTSMNYKIVEQEEMILTGYKRRFTGVPGERMEQEENMYVTTRPLQYMLKGLADNPVTNYDVITNIGDDGYDFYIASLLHPNIRNRLHEECILGEEYAKNFEHIVIPKQTYAVFETERCNFPTLIFLELRKKIASEWLPASGYRLADAPELVVTHWYMGDKRNERYRELWIPIEKK